MGAHDDPIGVLENMGLSVRDWTGPWQLIFTASTAISVVNAVVGGAAIAILLGVTLDLALGLAASVGVVFAFASVLFQLRYADRRHEAGAAQHDSLFPSPPTRDLDHGDQARR